MKIMTFDYTEIPKGTLAAHVNELAILPNGQLAICVDQIDQETMQYLLGNGQYIEREKMACADFLCHPFKDSWVIDNEH